MHPQITTDTPSSQPTHSAPVADYLEPPLEAPDVLQQIQQRQVLARAHPKHPLPPHGSRSGPPKQTWFLPGAKRVREGETGLEILRSAEWVAVRRGMFWTCNDQTANDALRARCFDYEYIRRRKMDATRPTWLETLCQDQWFVDDAPGFPTKSGFLKFITDLLHARRVGAIGVIISQADAGTLYAVSPRQWRRWMAHAESMGMVRILQLWQKCPKADRHRGHWKLCYMLGNSIIERAGVALYEGLDRTFANGRPMKPAAAAAAKRLRAARKESDRERHEELWQQSRAWYVRNRRGEPSSFSPDMVSGPTLQSRETGDPAPLVSPDGEIQITRADGATEIADVGVHGEGEGNPANAGAPLASLARSDTKPTASAVQPAISPDRGSSRIEHAKDVSSVETTFGQETNDMLSKLMANLRGPMMAFLFFLVTLTIGCREIHHTHDETTGSGYPGAVPTGTTWLGTSSGTTGGGSSSSATGGGAVDGDDPAVSPAIDDDDGSISDIPDDTWDDEISSESGDTYPWADDLLDDPCVFDCVSAARDIEAEWCGAVFSPQSDDWTRCHGLATDAVLLRCGQDCGCEAYCED